jgi:hypothetical protein
MAMEGPQPLVRHRAATVRVSLLGSSLFMLLLGLTSVPSGPVNSPALGGPARQSLPPVPANGILGFVVEEFYQPVIQGKDACPDGLAFQLKDAFLATVSPQERERLLLKENEVELSQRWKAYALGPDGTNICSQPDMFNRPPQRTVQSKFAWGLDLDGEDSADTCAHESFTTPRGERGIDNQEYRAMGCSIVWRGIDGIAGDQQIGMRQHLISGEWTQVLLLRGVDSFARDDDVEVIYANTPDRPVVDSNGKFLHGVSFAVSTVPPRERNVLNGRILNGVLTTEPHDIKLASTWGQGGARDIRGNRSKWDYRKGRLRLTIQSDGTLTGLLGGYRPLLDSIMAQTLGGTGSATVAGFDCAAELATLKKHADGLKDPRTGQCTGVSAAVHIRAVPAYVSDVPAARTANR